MSLRANVVCVTTTDQTNDSSTAVTLVGSSGSWWSIFISIHYIDLFFGIIDVHDTNFVTHESVWLWCHIIVGFFEALLDYSFIEKIIAIDIIVSDSFR